MRAVNGGVTRHSSVVGFGSLPPSTSMAAWQTGAGPSGDGASGGLPGAGTHRQVMPAVGVYGGRGGRGEAEEQGAITYSMMGDDVRRGGKGRDSDHEWDDVAPAAPAPAMAAGIGNTPACGEQVKQVKQVKKRRLAVDDSWAPNQRPWLGPFYAGMARHLHYGSLRVKAAMRGGDLQGMSDMICSVGFERDGQLFATAGVGRTIRLYEYEAVVGAAEVSRAAAAAIAGATAGRGGYGGGRMSPGMRGVRVGMRRGGDGREEGAGIEWQHNRSPHGRSEDELEDDDWVMEGGDGRVNDEGGVGRGVRQGSRVSEERGERGGGWHNGPGRGEAGNDRGGSRGSGRAEEEWVSVTQHPVMELATEAKLSCVCWNPFVRHLLASCDYDGAVQVRRRLSEQGSGSYGGWMDLLFHCGGAC